MVIVLDNQQQGASCLHWANLGNESEGTNGTSGECRPNKCIWPQCSVELVPASDGLFTLFLPLYVSYSIWADLKFQGGPRSTLSTL